MYHDNRKRCPSNGTDYHGRCLGECRECGTHLLSDGRYTVYCPNCDVCPLCGTFDGHSAGCPTLVRIEAEEQADMDLGDIESYKQADFEAFTAAFCESRALPGDKARSVVLPSGKWGYRLSRRGGL